MKFHISCRIQFLSPVLFVKSTCLSILFAIRLVRIVNSPRAFSVLILALLKTSLVLRFVCGHCDSCGNTSVRPSRLESSSRSVSCKYIGSGSTFSARSWLTYYVSGLVTVHFVTFFWKRSRRTRSPRLRFVHESPYIRIGIRRDLYRPNLTKGSVL